MKPQFHAKETFTQYSLDSDLLPVPNVICMCCPLLSEQWINVHSYLQKCAVFTAAMKTYSDLQYILKVLILF